MPSRAGARLSYLTAHRLSRRNTPPVTTFIRCCRRSPPTSTLIEVDGVIAQDRRPGGMACDDLTVFTSSYSAGSTREGTSYIRRAVIPLTVPSAAPTEVPRRVHRRA